MELAVGALALSAVSQVSQGITAGKIGEFNAKASEAEAAATRQKAEVDAEIQGRRDRKIIAAGRAQRGASGLDVNSGSPLVVEAEDEFLAELNRKNILFSGEVNALSFENQAKLDRAKGKARRNAAFIGAGTTLLTGASKVGQLGGGSGINLDPQFGP